MEAFRNPIILGFVAAYMLLTVLVGIWALRKTKSTQDFFMAGKDLGIMVTGFAVFSSLLSGFGFVGSKIQIIIENIVFREKKSSG